MREERNEIEFVREEKNEIECVREERNEIESVREERNEVECVREIRMRENVWEKKVIKMKGMTKKQKRDECVRITCMYYVTYMQERLWSFPRV